MSESDCGKPANSGNSPQGESKTSSGAVNPAVTTRIVLGIPNTSVEIKPGGVPSIREGSVVSPLNPVPAPNLQFAPSDPGAPAPPPVQTQPPPTTPTRGDSKAP